MNNLDWKDRNSFHFWAKVGIGIGTVATLYGNSLIVRTTFNRKDKLNFNKSEQHAFRTYFIRWQFSVSDAIYMATVSVGNATSLLLIKRHLGIKLAPRTLIIRVSFWGAGSSVCPGVHLAHHAYLSNLTACVCVSYWNKPNGTVCQDRNGVGKNISDRSQLPDHTHRQTNKESRGISGSW